jgi:alpha-galactosidase
VTHPWGIGRCAVALLLLAATLSCIASRSAYADTLAASPPMGWNSWDSYGFTIDEADFKANAAVLARFKRFGWTYAVIDEGWYMDNPAGDKLETRNYQLDGHGLLIPAINRFPSAKGSQGLRPLADWVHAQGLKLGIHVIRGIPKQAVRDDLPIARSNFHTSDAADTSDLCPWDDSNFGVRDNAAGQAYYDSMLRLYASWRIDFVKVDCIADHPYKASEIRQIAKAIKRSGRRMVLSLSPGPTQPSHASEVARHAQMWRISNDIWDGWSFTPKKPGDDFPNGIVTAFDNLPRWVAYAKPGNWPDADMLPFGSLSPHPGWGEPRKSRLTPEEQQTQFLLWAIARSPLILGTNLTELDELTRSLMTHHALIELNQGPWTSRPLSGLPAEMSNLRIWVTTRRDTLQREKVIAVFNLDDQPTTVRAAWSQVGMSQPPQAITDLVSGAAVSHTQDLQLTLPPHASIAYRLD